MAGSSLIALLDDIATVLDDVALMTKVAAKKTAGVLGDDLALNAHSVAEVRADRELPVVWAVAKGSFVNKAIIVPAALAISALVPWAVTPLLMAGGAFLCYEGVEKLVHKLRHGQAREPVHQDEPARTLSDPAVDLARYEQDKIRGAIRTDFILSAEIVTIALGTVAASPFITQVLVLSGIAIVMTVGVYGLVAVIVKLDDAGLRLSQETGESVVARVCRQFGATILQVAPYLMKSLAIVGTAAMFLVGGGILTHGIPSIRYRLEGLPDVASRIPVVGDALEMLAPFFLDALVGIIAGAVVLVSVTGFQRLLGTAKAA